jgi:hypothetical protein
VTKNRIALFIAALTAVTIAMLVIQSHRSGRVPRKQSSLNEFQQLHEILQALTVSLPSVAVTNNREVLRESLQRRQNAIEKLRARGTNILPRLMKEVRSVGRLEATNRPAARDATMRLVLAFEVLGDDAKPLLPELIDEFRSGRSIGPSIAGLASIGGTEAGFALISGLTNSDPAIRNASRSALSTFKTNREVAISAVPHLLIILKDDSPFSRALASSVLGSLRVKSEAVIPNLIQIAKYDTNFVARVSAIEAIGRFGTNAVGVTSDLEGIAMTDREPHVRRMALIAIQAVSGQISPDEVR